MAVLWFTQGAIRKTLALFTCVLLLAGGAPHLFAQELNATVTGVILDPAGAPAAGFRVMLRDTANNTVYTSAPTDAAGNYTLHVPVGGSYKLDGVRADDGITKLPVQDVAPISLLEAGTTRLNVRFTRGAAPASAAKEKEEKKGAAPWYQRPGPIVGMVFGAGVLAAIALSGSGDEASPFEPSTAD